MNRTRATALELGSRTEWLGELASSDVGAESFDQTGGENGVEQFRFFGWCNEFR